MGEEMSNENIDKAQIALGLMMKCVKCHEAKEVVELCANEHCNLVCGECCDAMPSCDNCGFRTNLEMAQKKCKK